METERSFTLAPEVEYSMALRHLNGAAQLETCDTCRHKISTMRKKGRGDLQSSNASTGSGL